MIDLTTVEILGGPATSDRAGHPLSALYTADRLTFHGKGLHRLYCEYIIVECIQALGKGYRPQADVASIFYYTDPEYADIEYFKKLRIAMRTIITAYEAWAAKGTCIVPEEWRSIWTDEEGRLRYASPPRVYDADDIDMWWAACLCSIGCTVHRNTGQVDMWDGREQSSFHLNWWFQQIGYSPSTDWGRCGKLILAAAEAAIKGGLISIPVSVRVDNNDSTFNIFDTITAEISTTLQAAYSRPATVAQQELQKNYHVASEYEPAGEFIAGVILTFLGKLFISIFCAFATGGGPWLVIWLTTALSQWSARDIGGLRQGQTCFGTGRHFHEKDKCRLKFLDTTCLTSAGSEHSRVLGVIIAAAGWGISRTAFSFVPQTRQLLTITEWDSTLGFTIGNTLLISVCFIGLLTMSYQTPKSQAQRYFLYRMGLEWGNAILAIFVAIVPVVMIKRVHTRWMLLAELAAWIIDAITTLFVVGTYPDCITAWHSVWVLVPALLSALAGVMGCWN